MKRHDNSDIKRENRRAIRIFIPILLASAVFGGCAGVLTVWLHDNPEMTASFLFWTNRILLACAPYTILVLTVLMMGCAYLLYGRAKHRFNQWNGEDETVIDQAENDLSKGMLLAQINQICIFFFFAVAYYISDPILFFIPLISFVLGRLFDPAVPKAVCRFLENHQPGKARQRVRFQLPEEMD